ncbi:jg644 [Pararge aegeria aegeria]|uniref:Jg644 protein n=1 Tax=Pararge aegeria aegeria TaxID=348720 RepID=A0A8S4QTP5_9NEOP|nr:jg644 [Pararge aegeria aegeria]
MDIIPAPPETDNIVRSENLTSSESEDSSSEGPPTPPKKRRRSGPERRSRSHSASEELERRFELLSQQLVSQVNNILCAQLAMPEPNSTTRQYVSPTEANTSVLQDPFSRPPGKIEDISELIVSIKEPTVSKAKPERVDKISAMQRFNSTDWNAVRYNEVQKKYVASPAFTELKVNEELRRFEDPFSPVRWFQMERSFAALSNAFLAQNELLNEALQSIMDWSTKSDTQITSTSVYDKLKQLFGNESNYKGISHDIFQIICGKRAEILELRRKQLLKGLKGKYIREDLEKIPRSSEYMFSPSDLLQYLQKIGGIDKLQKQNAEARPHSRARQKSPVPSTSAENSFRPQQAKGKPGKNRKRNIDSSDRKKKGGQKESGFKNRNSRR